MMICEECQEKEAEVVITEIDTKGGIKERHLCKACAAQKGYLLSKEKPLAELFTEFLKERAEGEEELRCSSCGMSWAEFRRLGRFGCQDCYKRFGARVKEMISHIQSTTQHTGRHASANLEGSVIFKELEKKRLRNELAQAIQDEDYERAAKIRDNLRRYEERS